MTTHRTFNAPWSRGLKLVSWTSLALFAGIPFIGIALIPPAHALARGSMIVIPFVLLLGAALFTVRGYRIERGSLAVHRLAWATRLDLTQLESAAHDPAAMSGAIRIAGNGGLFAYCGWFYSRKLGKFRAFATDPAQSVILRFRNRTVVITPDSPAELCAVLSNRISAE